MARTLPFSQAFPQNPIKGRARMNLGDVLYRLALIAPDQYEAIDVMARLAYKTAWPVEDSDPLELLEAEGRKLLR